MKILMVCLGNICRSPLAEGIMRQRAEERGIDIEVDSCGTSGWHNGEAPDIRSMENAAKNGIDISDLRSRRLKKADLMEFDKIYAMDTQNLSVLRNMADEEEEKKISLLLDVLYPGTSSEVPDPYYSGSAGFQDVFVLIDRAVKAILDNIEKNND